LDTIDAAIANGDLETAYAGLAFGLEPSDAQRSGRLLQLGDRFAGVEKADRAALAYQQVYDLAVISPGLTDPARADALLASGKGWAAIEAESQALEALDQAYLIAAQSPTLQMANRRDVLAALEEAYAELGDSARAEECRARIIELDQQTSAHPPVAPMELPDLPQGDTVVSSPEVGALEENRRQAAYTLLQVLIESGESPAELTTGLAEALKAEDAAKLDLYARELEGTTQPSRRIGVGWAMVRWLMLKYQVGSGALGLSVVPEWEAALPDIQSSLSKAYEGLFFDYEDLVTALPEASLMGPGSYQVRRQAVLDGRLGRYPNYPASQLADKLQDTALALISSGSMESLYVDVAREEEALHFFLSPASEYGLAAESP
jgi:tetratricopeptide (TPR) repeat protein